MVQMIRIDLRKKAQLENCFGNEKSGYNLGEL